MLLATLTMLGIHLTSWELVQAWYGAPDSRVRRQLTLIRVLRFEATYWALALASWPLWSSVLMEVVVAVDATIHLAGWTAGDSSRARVEAKPTDHRLAAALAIFHLVETLALLAIG